MLLTWTISLPVALSSGYVHLTTIVAHTVHAAAELCCFTLRYQCAGNGSGASLLRTSSWSEMILQLHQSVAGYLLQVFCYAHCLQGNFLDNTQR